MKKKLKYTRIIPVSSFVKPVVVAVVLLAISSLVWLCSTFRLGLSQDETLHEDIEKASPLRWLISISLPLLIVKHGLKRNSLNCSGAIVGFFVGFVLTLSNLCFCTCLLVFFFTSSRATKFRSWKKKHLEEDFKEGGCRNWIQVLCNGGVATVLGVLYLVDGGTSEIPVDFERYKRLSWISTAVLGALSCANGDTWASELGTVLAGSDPRLITTWEPVPRGTNGGVTIAGFVSSAAGGAVVGLGYYLSLLTWADSFLLEKAPVQWPLIVLGLFGGLYGSVVDSLLGATLQYSGRVRENGAIVESPRQGVEFISGAEWLDNHSVNLLASFITAITLPVLAKYWF